MREKKEHQEKDESWAVYVWWAASSPLVRCAASAHLTDGQGRRAVGWGAAGFPRLVGFANDTMNGKKQGLLGSCCNSPLVLGNVDDDHQICARNFIRPGSSSCQLSSLNTSWRCSFETQWESEFESYQDGTRLGLLCFVSPSRPPVPMGMPF